MSTEPKRHLGQRLPGGRTNLKNLRSRPGMAWTHVTSALGARSDRPLFSNVAAYCLFVGHARSGSTLVGSLLSAHPEIVIAHELDTLRFVQWHYTRDQLFHLVLRRDAEFGDRGRRHGANDYTYVVPDSWQGRFDTLRVLGDKKAGASTRKLNDHPELLERLRRTVGLPIRLIQITRNPFDNISSIARHGKGLEEASARYFARCDTLAKVHAATRDGEIKVVKHEDLVAEPAPVVARLCKFLGVDAPPQYLEACSGLVHPAPNRRRTESQWSPGLITDIERQIERFGFLEGYRFDDVSPSRPE